MGLGDSNSGQFFGPNLAHWDPAFFGGFWLTPQAMLGVTEEGLVPHSGVMIEHDMEKTCHDMPHDMTRYGMVLHDETRHDVV